MHKLVYTIHKYNKCRYPRKGKKQEETKNWRVMLRNEAWWEKTKKEKGLPVPNGVRIGGALDWEVDDATNHTSQDSSVAGSVTSPELLHLHTVAQRNGSLHTEETAAHRRHQHGGYTQQQWNETPHFRCLVLCFGLVSFGFCSCLMGTVVQGLMMHWERWSVAVCKGRGDSWWLLLISWIDVWL